MKIKKGDQVLVISGKDRGRKGKVNKIFPKEGKIIVEGINIIKKHIRPKTTRAKGQVITKFAPIDVSNVKLICSKCGQATRVGYKIIPNVKAQIPRSKIRICKKCQSEI